MIKDKLLRTVSIGASVLQYGCIAHCFWEYVGDFAICSGPSMMPTIKNNDIVLTEHMSVFSRNIERGDIIIARSPSNPHEFICKRVTQLEGDVIKNPPPDYSHKYVPKNHVWVEGDNSDNSKDSRSYGPIPYGLIRSRVFYKLWPPKDRQLLACQPNYHNH